MTQTVHWKYFLLPQWLATPKVLEEARGWGTPDETQESLIGWDWKNRSNAMEQFSVSRV